MKRMERWSHIMPGSSGDCCLLVCCWSGLAALVRQRAVSMASRGVASAKQLCMWAILVVSRGVASAKQLCTWAVSIASRGVASVRQLCVWAIWELGEPGLCFLCVYVGVLSTTLLPAALLAQLGLELASVTVSPGMALPIAIRVFDSRAYARWRTGGRVVLGVRMLRSCSDGITWVRWWRRYKR